MPAEDKERLCFRVSPDQRRLIEAARAQRGKESLEQFLRSTVLVSGRDDLLRELDARIGHCGTLLGKLIQAGQLPRRAGRDCVIAEFFATLNEIRAVLKLNE